MSVLDEEKRRLFGDIDDLIEISIEGKVYEVPRYLELLRAFQFLEFDIAFEHFCWNASCENCVTTIIHADGQEEEVMCCQEPSDEGLSVPKLPDKISSKETGGSK